MESRKPNDSKYGEDEKPSPSKASSSFESKPVETKVELNENTAIENERKDKEEIKILRNPSEQYEENMSLLTMVRYANTMESNKTVKNGCMTLVTMLSGQLNKSMQRNETLICKINESQQLNDTLICKINESQQLSDTLICKINESQQLNDTLLCKINESQQLNDTLISKLDESSKQYDDAKAELQQVILTLISESKSKDLCNERLEKRVNDLLLQIDQLMNDYQDFRKEEKKYRDEIQELINQRNDLPNCNSESDERVANLTQENEMTTNNLKTAIYELNKTILDKIYEFLFRNKRHP